MQTSFALWLEARDPELFMVLEAEFKRRDRSPLKRGVAAATGTGLLGMLGLGIASLLGGGDKAEKPKIDDAPRSGAIVKKMEVEDTGEPSKYKGGDKEDIFNYACQQSHNGISIFPYYVNGKQEGLIARYSMAATPTSPLSDKSLKDQYYSFVGNVRATMKGRNVLKADSAVFGQGPVKWEYVAIGRNNPNRGEAGMVEIVLYAQKPVGER